MGERQPRYSKEEFARRGQAIYEKRVGPQVEEYNRGKIVAIDVETGEFEVGEDTPKCRTGSGRSGYSSSRSGADSEVDSSITFVQLYFFDRDNGSHIGKLLRVEDFLRINCLP